MKRIRKFRRVVVFAVFMFSAISVFGSEAGISELFTDMKAEPRALGAPEKSDVCLSSRWVHPRDANDPYETFDICEKFHATRLEWMYTDDAEFIRKANDRGLDVIATLNGTMSDVPGKEIYEKGRVKNPEGEKVAPPWMTWKPTPYMGCANSKSYKANILRRAKKILDAGAKGLQFDDPYLNRHAQHWDICFCDYCMDGFRVYLKKMLTWAQLRALGIKDVDSFSYKEYRLKGGDSAVLKTHFFHYQLESVVDYHNDIQSTLERKYGREIPFSCNNSSITWHVPFNLFDYGMCELAEVKSNPRDLYEKIRYTYSLGKSQVVTFHNTDVALSRKLIGTTYGLGINPVVPWDVWIKGTSRYYGKPEEYSDMYGFVRAEPELFDGYSLVTVESFDIKDENDDLIKMEVGKKVFAAMRAVPGDLSRPVVVHLVDWAEKGDGFKVAISEDKLPFDIGEVRLYRPVEYDKKMHEEVQKSGDFSKLSEVSSLDYTRKEGKLVLELPEIEPWAIMVLRK